MLFGCHGTYRPFALFSFFEDFSIGDSSAGNVDQYNPVVRLTVLSQSVIVSLWLGESIVSFFITPYIFLTPFLSDIAVFDPIDGSKNIDASLPVGSIFGIYKKQPGTQVDDSTFLQDGRALVAAGYCLFS